MGDMKHVPHKLILLLSIMALFAASVNSLHAAADEKRIIAFGDSLTAGLGIPYNQAFPAQLEAKLRAKGYNVQVVNAGVSGETTAGGLARLEWTLNQKPDYVIFELGANDMLRGIDPALTKQNLQKMLDILKQHNIPVLFTGMKAFANLGPKFTAAYEDMYASLAKQYHALYYPFFLDGVALHPDLLQEDGLHPNPAGVSVIVTNILPSVEKLLKQKPAAEQGK
jgi:acyl-CoA thioesterase-1